jgi:phosphatidylglycerol lysyltransferase
MIAVFTGMVYALTRLLRSYSYEDISAGFGSVSAGAVGLAILFVSMQYALMTVREWLGARYAGHAELGYAKPALASTIARPLSTLGVSTITGIGLRARIYGEWGFATKDLALITAYDAIGYYVGIAATCGLVLSVSPVPWPESIPWELPPTWIVGVVGTILVVAYAIWATRRKEPIHIRKVEVPVPDHGQLAGQIVLPVLDLCLTAAIVYVMLPGDARLPYFQLVAVCLVANLAGSLSQVPAGLGVFETVMLQFTPSAADESAVLGALLVRRTITNLLPMAVGAVLLFWFEVNRRPRQTLHTWHNDTIATILSVLTFASGVILLVLGLEPGVKRALAPSAPGPVFLVVIGVWQLVVARGLQHRTVRAWRVAIGLLLLRGIGELAMDARPIALVIIGGQAALFLAFRRTFTEHGVVLRAEIASWWAGIVMALVATVGVAYFAGDVRLSRVSALQLTGAAVTLSIAALLVGYQIAKHRRATTKVKRWTVPEEEQPEDVRAKAEEKKADEKKADEKKADEKKADEKA